MADLSIGVMLDSFRLPLNEALVKAHEVGAQGIQIYATKGEMAPENLNTAARRELLDRIKSNGLKVSACAVTWGWDSATGRKTLS